MNMKYKAAAINQPKAMNTMSPSRSSSPTQMSKTADTGNEVLNGMPKQGTVIKRPAAGILCYCLSF
jgi:hypothetical protein